jgi:DNA repair photolyase
MAGYPEIAEMSMTLVAISNSHGIPCSLLTKGLLPAHLADRLRFPMDNVHEISLISLDEDFRERWEPGTAPYKSRILALKYLHDRGRRTVVHIEPYPTPNLIVQDLKDILTAVEFADGIYFSGWNYNALVRQYPRFREFYRDQTDLVKRFCRERGKTCETGE